MAVAASRFGGDIKTTRAVTAASRGNAASVSKI